MTTNINSAEPHGKHYVFFKDIIAEFLRWIVRQHPMTNELPDLNAIVNDLSPFIQERLRDRVIDGMYGVEAQELRELCRSAAHAIPSIANLNLSKVEREAGIAVDDPSRPQFAFTSRYDRPKSEHDFIDLDALAMNVSRTLMEP